MNPSLNALFDDELIDYTEISDNEDTNLLNQQENSNKFTLCRGFGVYIVTIDEFKEIQHSSFIQPLPNPKIPQPQKIPSIYDLPEEILLMIMEYLSPIEIIRASMTCKLLNDLSYDRELWRRIGIVYNKLFIWKRLELFQKKCIFWIN
eukprot:Anaeramoba_ignava/a222965_9.p2 GENE.a222965_9~~a222965_9.p2  ORF type:complete len:148 (+),score=40.88 a222965_9:15-458(+)